MPSAVSALSPFQIVNDLSLFTGTFQRSITKNEAAKMSLNAGELLLVMLQDCSYRRAPLFIFMFLFVVSTRISLHYL